MNVSRETEDKLRTFVSLVEKWNPHINLVAKSTLEGIWERHIRDSAQLFDLKSSWGKWSDFGSGGGFPGIVVAILADDTKQPVVLVESDQRKCEFLRHVGRELSLEVEVRTDRIERLEPLSVDIISARALAPLDKLLEFSERHRAPGGIAFFPKGREYMGEIEAAKRRWNLDYLLHPSVTDPASVIIEVKDFSRVAA